MHAITPAKISLAFLATLLFSGSSLGQTVQNEAVEIRPTPEVETRFGISVAVSDDWMAVGDFIGDSHQGSVDMYKWTTAGWDWFQQITSPEPGLGYRFGNRLDLDGSRLIVGSPGWGWYQGGFGTPYFMSGKAFLFEWDGVAWNLALTLRPTVTDINTNTVEGSQYGSSVQIEGDRMAISASQTNPIQGNGSGVVYMYQRLLGNWQLEQVLFPNIGNPAPGIGYWAAFGYSLSLDGDRIAISAPGAFDGMASVWKKTSAGWQVEAYFASPLGASSSCTQWFGASVSLSGNRLAIGMPSVCAIANPFWPSAVTIEEFAGGQWQRTQIIQDGNLQPGGEKALMGAALELIGDLLCIGMPGMRMGTERAAEIRLYEYVQGSGFQAQKSFRHRNAPLFDNVALGYQIAFDPERGRIIGGDPWYQYTSPTSPLGWAGGDVLHFDMELGEDLVCQGTQNSSGRASHLAVTGSLNVAEDRLTLHGSGLPPGEFALFLYGQPGPTFPILTGGQLCLTGGVSRMMPPGPVGHWGQRVQEIDFTVPREAANLMPGTTWAFQVWHRDFIGGASVTGTTNAVRVTMQ